MRSRQVAIARIVRFDERKERDRQGCTVESSRFQRSCAERLVEKKRANMTRAHRLRGNFHATSRLKNPASESRGRGGGGEMQIAPRHRSPPPARRPAGNIECNQLA